MLLDLGFRKVSGVAVGLLLSASSPLVFGQEPTRFLLGEEQSLGIVKNVGIEVVDQVTDGCWTNVGSVENRLSAKLEQAGISTYDEPLGMNNGFNVNLVVNVVGYESSRELCAGYFQYFLEVSSAREFNDPDSESSWRILYDSRPFERGVLFTGPRNLNEQILSSADSYTDELITLVYQGRRIDRVEELSSVVGPGQSVAITREELNALFEDDE